MSRFQIICYKIKQIKSGRKFSKKYSFKKKLYDLKNFPAVIDKLLAVIIFPLTLGGAHSDK